MNDIETKQLILDILNKAQEGKSFKFQYIGSWHEFRYYTKLIKSNKLIVKTLQTSANNLFSEYCKDVTSGISDVNKLLAYSQLRDVITFYEDDVNTLQQMLDEFDEYVEKGNFLYTILGGEREF